jgi:D-serine deaminase-like pyridoxal phosphate-dependent protein
MKDIETPALLLDKKKFDSNARKMSDFFVGKNVKVRPHAKTHKCARIAKEQLAKGAIGITCAKLSEAESMVENGIEKILIANEIVEEAKIRRLALLNRKAKTMVALDDYENAVDISSIACEFGLRIPVLVDVNVGMNRCGVEPDECVKFVKAILQRPGLEFAGIMGYEGHAVLVPDIEERRKKAVKSMETLVSCANAIKAEGVRVDIVSGGGTGTYNISSKVEGITEIQAGSYILMDNRYSGVTPEFEKALSVLCTVISAKSPDRIVTDCGVKAVAKDFGMPTVKDRPDLDIRMLCEENAVICANSANIPHVGDKLEIYPSHICTTVALHDKYHVIEKGNVVDVWDINARGKFF